MGKKVGAIRNVLLLVPAVLATGCLGLGGGEWGWGEPTDGTSTGTSAAGLEILSSVLRGDVFDVVGIDEAALVEEMHYDGYSSINSTVENLTGAAMTILEIQGGLNHPDLVPGAHFVFDNDTWATSADDLNISVIGCSGPEPGYWQHDQPADEVEVDVEEDPQDPRALALTYRAVFPGQEAWSSDTVSVPPTVVTGVVRVLRSEVPDTTTTSYSYQ